MIKSALFRPVLGIIISFGVVSSGFAANADFQNFFFLACVNPAGQLAVRCGETAGATGNLSGDSESSLNPSQTLSSNDASLGIARKRAKENRERFEQLHDSDTVNEARDEATQIGPFSLLINGRYTDFDKDAVVNNAEQRGFDGDGWAAELGFDYRFSERTIGGAILSYQESDSTFNPENSGVNFTPALDAGGMESDGYALTLFVSSNLTDNFYLEGSLGYGTTDYTFNRNSVFQESNRVIAQTNVSTTADTDGDETWASFSGGYEFGSGAFSIGPYAGVIWTQTHIDGYTENDLLNTGLNMQVTDTDLDSLLGQFGIRASYAISASWGVIVPQVRVEYDYEFEDDAPTAGNIFVLDSDQTLFNLAGDTRDESFVDLGISLVLVAKSGWSMFFDYSTLLDYDDLERDTFTVGLRKEF